MRKITTTVYSFNELNPIAQEKALKIIGLNSTYDLWYQEKVYKDFVNYFNEKYNFNLEEANLESSDFYYSDHVANISFSLSEDSFISFVKKIGLSEKYSFLIAEKKANTINFEIRAVSNVNNNPYITYTYAYNGASVRHTLVEDQLEALEYDISLILKKECSIFYHMLQKAFHSSILSYANLETRFRLNQPSDSEFLIDGSPYEGATKCKEGNND